VVEQAGKYRLPFIYPYCDYVDAGGLTSYAPALGELAERLANDVHQILNGLNRAKSVLSTTKFQLLIIRGSHLAKDVEGTELPGLEEAKAMARDTAREMLANAIRSGDQQPVEVVTILDESGLKLAEIAARDVLPEPLK
jgi:hypothetical protein